MHRKSIGVILLLIAVGGSAQAADLAKQPRWRPVRDGVIVDQKSGLLRVAYRVVSGKPAGAALPLKPGALEGVSAIRIRLGANRNVPLIVSLTDSRGVVYAFPAIHARAATRDYELAVNDLSFSPQQSRAEDPGSYRIADTVMMAIVDVTGFMSSETPDVEWTVESAEAVQ